MARKRNLIRDEAHRIWLKSNKQKPLEDIADELGISASTVRKWKSENKWNGETKRYDSLKDNQNAEGKSGGGTLVAKINPSIEF